MLSSWVGGSHNDITVRIRHDEQKNGWAVESLDNWNEDHFEVQWALECDSDLLSGIMGRMMDQRSRADLTPEVPAVAGQRPQADLLHRKNFSSPSWEVCLGGEILKLVPGPCLRSPPGRCPSAGHVHYGSG